MPAATPGTVTAPVNARSPLARYRRNRELSLGVLALIITGGGLRAPRALEGARASRPGPAALFAVLVGLFGVAHLAVRRLAPRADATLLPIVSLLLGIGFVMLTRLDLHPDRDTQGNPIYVAPTQAVWIAVGIAVFVLTLVFVRNARSLSRYKYTFLLLGVGALLLPARARARRRRSTVPASGSASVGFTIQPGEIAKVLLVIFFAAYLVEKRELLSSGSRRLGRLHLPDPKHLGPLLVPWALSILIMVQQKDLGSSLLFFAVFMAMLYIATRRSAYVIVGRRAVRRARWWSTYQLFAHVQDRVTIWLDPWQDPSRPRLPDHAEPLRVRQRRVHRQGHRPRHPVPDPGAQHRLHLRRHRRGARADRHRRGRSARSCSSWAARTASRSRRRARSPSCSRPGSRRASACRRS